MVVDRFESFRLTFSSTIFFGVQFHTLDQRRMKVIKLKPKAAAPAQGGAEGTGDNTPKS